MQAFSGCDSSVKNDVVRIGIGDDDAIRLLVEKLHGRTMSLVQD